MPPDLVARVRQAGLFRIAQARDFGGAELDPSDIVTVFEELCRGDASAGWTTMIGNGAPAFASWLDPDVAHDLLGADADFTSASIFAPMGRGADVGDGNLTVDGSWQWASGSRHAEWFANGLFVFDGDAPRMVADRGPDWRLAFFPSDRVEIIDNWDVAGMRGTGSNDVAVHGLVVPLEHTISPFFEPARQDGPLWRLPFFTLIGVTLVGFPLGVGRRALDELAELAMTKIRSGSFEPVGEDPAAQVELARAEGSLQGARSFVFDAVGDIWDSALAGDEPSVHQRARLQLAAQEAMRAAVEAVDTAFHLAGGGAIHSASPLQRCFRDLHTVKQHVYFGSASLKRYARHRLAIDQSTFGM